MLKNTLSRSFLLLDSPFPVSIPFGLCVSKIPNIRSQRHFPFIRRVQSGSLLVLHRRLCLPQSCTLILSRIGRQWFVMRIRVRRRRTVQFHVIVIIADHIMALCSYSNEREIDRDKQAERECEHILSPYSKIFNKTYCYCLIDD